MTTDTQKVQAVVAKLEKFQVKADANAPGFKRDGVACFNYLYTIITKNVRRCVAGGEALQPGDPIFNDRRFMATFDVAFADRYFAAMEIGTKPPFQPRCWTALVDHRGTPHISPMAFAVAGVNSHVNFDLAFALVSACEEMGLDPSKGTVHADYELINRIFAIHMEQLRQHFETRFVRGVDKGIVAKIANVLGDRAVKAARDLVWREAMELWRIRDDKAEMLRVAQSRDAAVAVTNEALFEIDRFPAMI